MKGRLFRIFNSYSFNFSGRLCNRCAGFYLCPGDEQFQSVIFEKITSGVFTSLPFTHFFYSSKLFSFEMPLVRSSIANFCPIMSHLNALDFNECWSEEVINFF